MCCIACKAKLKKVYSMVKWSLFPNMNDIEEKKLYTFNLSKAWIAAMCSNGYRVIAFLFGFGQWQ